MSCFNLAEDQNQRMQMRKRGAYIQMAVANTKVSYLAIASEISV